jgi:type IV pilus assembly protein PilN
MVLVALSATLAVLVMLVPYALQGRRLARLATQTNELERELTSLNKQAAEVQDLEEKRSELRSKLLVIDELEQKRVGPARVLEDLAASSPDKLWLVDFKNLGNDLTITGIALDNQTIATFMTKLGGSSYFYDVDLVETAHTEPLQRTAIPLSAGFKKFIVKARIDYSGQGGKNAAKANEEQIPRKKGRVS